ncbi:alpha/beta hydrolase family protein [Streptodolium elevatio]|uniref:Alpha/beta fold hydrolase n=1 Tax=Streptodolium elevatio TaxID=3157996 RepID=A0ABV3DHL9_9ACTN
MFDPVGEDPPLGLAPPAWAGGVVLESAGVPLAGMLHVPGGPGPHPVVVLCHGFPGNERNFDLAHALSRAGYAALVFHYRGSWGMGGTWTWQNVQEDAANVVAAVRAADFAAKHRLDAGRVALVGHSLGGFTALRTAAADPAVRAVASVAAFDFGIVPAAVRGNAQARAMLVAAFQESVLPLSGTSGEALVAELEGLAEDWGLASLAPRLAGRPVLLVAAERDTAAEPEAHHVPVVKAYEEFPVAGLEHLVMPTDHGFADHRIALTRVVIGFLGRSVPV